MIVMLSIGLIFRSFGTYLSTSGTDLNKKEKLFCIFAELPKATVQAAIGGIPLSKGLNCGDMVLSLAVISILITAPIGAIIMEKTYKIFCERN